MKRSATSLAVLTLIAFAFRSYAAAREVVPELSRLSSSRPDSVVKALRGSPFRILTTAENLAPVLTKVGEPSKLYVVAPPKGQLGEVIFIHELVPKVTEAGIPTEAASYQITKLNSDGKAKTRLIGPNNQAQIRVNLLLRRIDIYMSDSEDFTPQGLAQYKKADAAFNAEDYKHFSGMFDVGK